MFARSLVILLFASTLGHAGEPVKKSTDLMSAHAKVVVEKQVKEWKGEGFKLEVVNDKVVRETFPNHVFVAVHFPLWPVARVPAEPLMSQNLFAVSKEGKVTHLPNAENKLAQFFGATLGKKADQSAVAKSWLILRMEYIQDGYYKFKQPGKMTPLNDLVMGDIEVVPENGNSGNVKVVIRFSESQRFTVVSEELNVVRGMRPRRLGDDGR